ncbi:MAG: extracellular solute-binding protein family 5, partial [Firmicutes bacterium]|nr:extracellular solute-binding protein family 5 [Bacillota bacterium]
ETLVKMDKDGKMQPGLARSWQVSPDGLTVNLALQTGVKFHDGTPFNAKAVKFSLERVLNADVRVPTRFPYQPIQSIDTPDDATVVLKLKSPSPTLIAALSWTTSGIISPDSVTKLGNTAVQYQHPVGTGPYVFADYAKGKQIKFTKFADYWGKKPYYDTVVMNIVPDAASRETMLLAGQVDLVITPPISDVPALQKNNNVKVLLAPSARTIFIGINNQDPALKDKRVRQALNYAVNKEAIVKSLLFGAGDVMDSPMGPSLFGYAKTGPYPYDPEKAKSLLAQAGVKDLTLKFISPTGRYLQDYQAAQAIAGDLEKVGIKTNLSTMDWATYVATIGAPPDKNTTQLHLLGSAPSFPDASMHMVNFTTDFIPPKGFGTSLYSNPAVDALVNKANVEVDQAKRQQLYADAQKLVWDDAPWIFLWLQRFPIVHSAKVTNIGYLPNEKFDALYAEPAK